MISKAYSLTSSVQFSPFLWSDYNAECLKEAIVQTGMLLEEIVTLELCGDDVCFAWGKIFDVFKSLKKVNISSKNQIKLNCYNFDGSSVEDIKLSAPTVWFNDGTFMNTKHLISISINAEISNGQHGGLTELLFKNCEELRFVSGCYHGHQVMPCLFEN